MYDFERQMEARDRRRGKADDRFLTRMEKLEQKAKQLVGELIREGRTIFYINLQTRDGHMTGRTREFGENYGEAIGYLIRNKYV